MKSFKHFKEDSDSDDKGSESLSKLKSRRELAKQKSRDSLERFKDRVANRDKEVDAEIKQAADRRSDDAEAAREQERINQEKNRQQGRKWVTFLNLLQEEL